MKRLDIKEEREMPYNLQDIIRRIKVNIEFSGTGQKSICITSSVANEGKSTIAFQVAKAFAEDEGKSVLFIDADIRNSVSYKRLGFERTTPGLTDYLVGKIDITETIYQTNIKRLYMVPCGRKTKNSTQMFRREAFETLMTKTKDTFDIVIIDTPPIGLVIDAAIIASLSDASVMVVGANMLSRSLIKRNIDTLKKANENFLGVVLNMAKEKTDGYGYGYGYYYYGKEDEKDEQQK